MGPVRVEGNELVMECVLVEFLESMAVETDILNAEVEEHAENGLGRRLELSKENMLVLKKPNVRYSSGWSRTIPHSMETRTPRGCLS